MQQYKKNRTDQVTAKIIPYIPNGDFCFVRGVKAFTNRKFELALKWMKKAVDLDPNQPLYQCQLSVIYTEIGLYNEANKLLSTVLQTSDDEYVDCYYLMANNYAHLGLMNEAKKHAHLYLEKDSDGDFKEDAFDLLELLEMNDEDFIEDDLLIYQETVFHHMEDLQWEQALTLLEEMLTLFPDHHATKHDIAQCLFYLGRQEKAINMEQDLLMEEPNDLYSYLNLANFYIEKQNKQAYDYYVSVLLNIHPIHDHQKLRLAITLAKANYYEEAYRRFTVLTKEMVTTHTSYYRWYSVAAYYVGKTQKSRWLWEEGCKIHPKLKAETAPWQS
ncbi:tetratricopeptide repeat protein [Virgibacillus sp. MSJ-26]|uniref:tetratricopeptide repeat protein n=1 Tax=Virgibacillus sp. MSJ-26 TaxID=2841522 RepID=UPI001C128776|nr:tetratricopeptide repeat protein [Virgibacillus sp. MSJ-26]MBU5468243.1 tetratricopeptide repeat protein [Virgibacillus sp. MSJ-26]